MPNWTKEMDQVLRKGWVEGLSETLIASQIVAVAGGIGAVFSRSSISGRRRRLGLPAREAEMRRETLVLSNARRRKNFLLPPESPAAVTLPPKGTANMTKFEPLPGATPRPWLSRKFNECAWPVGGQGADTLSCCAPVLRAPGAPYCERHSAMAYGSQRAS